MHIWQALRQLLGKPGGGYDKNQRLHVGFIHWYVNVNVILSGADQVTGHIDKVLSVLQVQGGLEAFAVASASGIDVELVHRLAKNEVHGSVDPGTYLAKVALKQRALCAERVSKGHSYLGIPGSAIPYVAEIYAEECYYDHFLQPLDLKRSLPPG